MVQPADWTGDPLSEDIRTYPQASQKERQAVKDYLHKITRYIVEYCREKEITSVILTSEKESETEKRKWIDTDGR